MRQPRSRRRSTTSRNSSSDSQWARCLQPASIQQRLHSRVRLCCTVAQTQAGVVLRDVAFPDGDMLKGSWLIRAMAIPNTRKPKAEVAGTIRTDAATSQRLSNVVTSDFRASPCYSSVWFVVLPTWFQHMSWSSRAGQTLCVRECQPYAYHDCPRVCRVVLRHPCVWICFH